MGDLYHLLILFALRIDFRDGRTSGRTAFSCFVLTAETRMTIKGYSAFLGPVQVKMPQDSWHFGKGIQPNLSKGAKICRVKNLQAIGQRIHILMTGSGNSVSLRAGIQGNRCSGKQKAGLSHNRDTDCVIWCGKACSSHTENHGITDIILITWDKKEVWYQFQKSIVDNQSPLLWERKNLQLFTWNR